MKYSSSLCPFCLFSCGAALRAQRVRADSTHCWRSDCSAVQFFSLLLRLQLLSGCNFTDFKMSFHSLANCLAELKDCHWYYRRPRDCNACWEWSFMSVLKTHCKRCGKDCRLDSAECPSPTRLQIITAWERLLDKMDRFGVFSLIKESISWLCQLQSAANNNLMSFLLRSCWLLSKTVPILKVMLTCEDIMLPLHAVFSIDFTK